jgi:hypothetical protein
MKPDSIFYRQEFDQLEVRRESQIKTQEETSKICLQIWDNGIE